MKIWEAIIYAIIGGITEILPISFSGHSILFENTFHLSPLYSGDGPFVRAGISVGIVIALYIIFHREAGESKQAFRTMGSGRASGRASRRDEESLKTRVLLLSVIGFIPMLFSLIFLGKAEGMSNLTSIAILFAINGLLILICTRGAVGKRGEREATLYDMILMGLLRMISVFPGLSSSGTSLCIGRARGLSNSFNIRITYMLTMAFQILSCVFYLIRGIFMGDFYGRTLLSFLVAVIFSAGAAFLALITFRNMVMKNKLKAFMYYCFDAAAIAFIIAIING